MKRFGQLTLSWENSWNVLQLVALNF